MFKRRALERLFNSLNHFFVGPILKLIFWKSGLSGRFRFLNTNPAAIGHLCLDVEAFAKEAAIKGFPFRGVLLADRRRVANSAISRMWGESRRILVIDSPVACYFFDRLRTFEETGFDCSSYCADISAPARFHEVYSQYRGRPSVARWPRDLCGAAKALFSEIFPDVESRRLIAFHSRDSIFDLKNQNPNYFMHRHRNSDLVSYYGIFEFLRNRGYSIIRVGEYGVDDSHFGLDYLKIPKLPKADADLINAYIAYVCSLFLGCNSGALALAAIWERPIFLLNFLPYYSLRQYTSRSMAIPKLLMKSGKVLSAEEIFSNGYHEFVTDSQYSDRGIEIVVNDASDCLKDFEEFFKAFVEGDEDLRIELTGSVERENYAMLAPENCFDRQAAGLIPRHFFRKYGIV